MKRFNVMFVCILVFLGFSIKVTWMKQRPKGNQEKLNSYHKEREPLVAVWPRA
jgi:hypothetical protein